MIINYKEFLLEEAKIDKNWAMRTIEYSILVKDYTDNPTIYATEYKIIKIEDDEVECKLKGIELVDLSEHDLGIENKKYGWIEIDETAENKTRTISKKSFSNGVIRKKVYTKKED